MNDTVATVRNGLGHFHPALVHFPVGLLLTGAALEGWQVIHGKTARSSAARLLLALGTAGALLAMLSGLALYHPDDFQSRALAVARMHRLLGLCAASTSAAALIAGVLERSERRFGWYRLTYFAAAALVGLAGHYGGWVVFGWGKVWTW